MAPPGACAARTCEALADWDVTPHQARALRVLVRRRRDAALGARRGAAHRPALGDRGGRRAGGARAGARGQPDPTDRRATRWRSPMTAGGWCERIDDVRREASERVLDVLTAAQRRTLHEILTVVVGEDQ